MVKSGASSPTLALFADLSLLHSAMASFAPSLRYGQHPIERDHRVRGGLWIDRHLIDDIILRQVLQCPEQVGRMNAIHRRAGADRRIEAKDRFVRQLLLQA